jgi:hypothetical protein
MLLKGMQLQTFNKIFTFTNIDLTATCRTEISGYTGSVTADYMHCNQIEETQGRH